MKKCKKVGYCSTPPRGKGQLQYGNFTGTVSSAGFSKIFVLEFSTKTCLKPNRISDRCIFRKMVWILSGFFSGFFSPRETYVLLTDSLCFWNMNGIRYSENELAGLVLSEFERNMVLLWGNIKTKLFIRITCLWATDLLTESFKLLWVNKKFNRQYE